jgi:tRNA (5-methylaminomethyl-2-thiouridylate)-methyltransferase
LKRNNIFKLLFIAFLISHTIITIDNIPICHSFTTSTTNPTTNNRFLHDDSSKQKQQQGRHQRSKISPSSPTITYSPTPFSTTRQQRLIAAASTSTENDDDDANFDRNRRRNNLDDVNNNNYDDDDASVEEIQQRLVQEGLTWNQSSLEDLPDMVRVPGCVATVYVLATITATTTIIIEEDDNDDDDDEGSQRRKVVPVVQLYGNSDAIVSRGLLSELAAYLKQSSSIDEVLKLDPNTVADILGVRPALSRGRNDGLGNMLEIIQKQLSLLPPYEKSTLKNDLTDVINNNDNNNDNNNTTIISSSSSISPLLSDDSNKKPTVALLLSGGVDSSVAFRLLLQQGYDVVPFYLKIWLEDELAHLGECPWEDDVQSCRDVCDQVNIELQIISLQDEYHKHVMQHTLNEASLGRTPNPDILCNSRVKFGCFLEYLKGLPNNNQFDYIASGHYAQVKRKTNDNDNCGKKDDSDDGIARLYRAPDPVKDQSYFLCALDQSQLRRLLFPIGHLEKTEVRQLAEDFQLPNRNRPDSQGLCFLGKVKFRDFMQIHLGEKYGDLVDAVTGEIIGEHHGVWYHTVGQRKGIGPYLKPKATALGPWYVVAKVCMWLLKQLY